MSSMYIQGVYDEGSIRHAEVDWEMVDVVNVPVQH